MQATRTYLELSRESQFKPGFGAFPDLVIERVERPTPELYRECYRTVGEAYHWRDRWDWTDAEIRVHLAQPEITLHVARRRGALARSEEHTSELQSLRHLVCRLLLEKKKKNNILHLEFKKKKKKNNNNR